MLQVCTSVLASKKNTFTTLELSFILCDSKCNWSSILCNAVKFLRGLEAGITHQTANDTKSSMSSNQPIVSKCLYYTDQDRYILFFIRGISYWPVHQALPPFSSLHYTLFLLGKHTKFSECKPRHIAPFPAANMSCKLARAFFFCRHAVNKRSPIPLAILLP